MRMNNVIASGHVAFAHGCTLLALLTLSPLAVAGSDERATFSIENDMWGRPSSDRNYTMGLAYTRHLKRVPDDRMLTATFGALDFINGALFRAAPDTGSSARVMWTLASSNFTPQEVRDPLPIKSDRPYASLQYLGVGRTDRLSDDVTRDTGLEIGVLGTNIGYVVQTAIHRLCCKDRLPRGWDNQIGDGGALTFLYRSKWSLSTGEQQLGSGKYAALASLGGNVGYYTRAIGGISLLYGASPRDFRDLYIVGGVEDPHPFILSSMSDAMNASADTVREARSQATDTASPSRGFALWLNYELSLFAYNQLLQGAWFGRNNVTFRSSEIERVVHRINMGAELTFIPKALGLVSGDDLRLYWTQSFKSQDLKSPNGRRHYWGGLYASWAL
jgi:Uncharacterized protein conserved in bacteria (DUF2219)